MTDGRHGKGKVYSSAQARQMFHRVRETREKNIQAERDAVTHRATDPFEIAKTFLNRRGFIVYSHSIIQPDSKLIVVGRQLMSREEMIAMADQISARINPKEKQHGNTGNPPSRAA